MTASEPNGSRSENSVSRPLPRDRLSLTRDPRTRRIVQYADNQNGATSIRDIAAAAGWTLQETRTHVERLERANFVQLLGEDGDGIVLLTVRGENVARGRVDS